MRPIQRQVHAAGGAQARLPSSSTRGKSSAWMYHQPRKDSFRKSTVRSRHVEAREDAESRRRQRTM